MNLLFPIDPIKRKEMIDRTPKSSRKEDRENYVDKLVYELQGYYDFFPGNEGRIRTIARAKPYALKAQKQLERLREAYSKALGSYKKWVAFTMENTPERPLPPEFFEKLRLSFRGCHCHDFLLTKVTCHEDNFNLTFSTGGIEEGQAPSAKAGREGGSEVISGLTK